MISMTAKATVIVVTMMFSVIFAYGSVATELSKNEATQDQPMIITKHHGWQELAPKDIGTRRAVLLRRYYIHTCPVISLCPSSGLMGYNITVGVFCQLL